MRISVFTVAILFCFIAHTSECEVVNPSVDNISEYLHKMALSFTGLNIDLKETESESKKKKPDATQGMLRLKEMKSSFLCAASMIGSYKKSKNKNIATSSEELSQAYQAMAAIVENSIADYKRALDDVSLVSEGDRADKESERILEIRKKWRDVMSGMIEGTYAAIENVDSKAENPEKLLISKNDRDSILKELKSEFKLPIKKGKKMTALDEIADAYFEFLTAKWKFK